MTTGTSVRPYDLVEATIYVASTDITGNASTTTFTAGAAHGCAVGDMVIITTLGGSSLSLATRYFVIAIGGGPPETTFQVSTTYGGSAVTIGTATNMVWRRYVPYTFPWTQSAGAEAETRDITWTGNGARETIQFVDSVRVSIALDALPVSVHQAIFSKTAITGPLPGGGSNGRSVGGGSDIGGVVCALQLKGYAIRDANGVRTTPRFNRWFPSGTLTMTGIAGLTSGEKASTTGYSFTANRTTTDFLGGTLTGASTGGDFMVDFDTTT